MNLMLSMGEKVAGGTNSPPVTGAVKVMGWPTFAGLKAGVGEVVVGDKTVASIRVSSDGLYPSLGSAPWPPRSDDLPATWSQVWTWENHMAATPVIKRSAAER